MKKVLSTTLGFMLLVLVASVPWATASTSGETDAESLALREADNTGASVLYQSNHGGAIFSKAFTDTFFLYGGPGALEGKFQSVFGGNGGAGDLQGWTGVDATESNPFWHISTFNAENFSPGGVGNNAYWSGVGAGAPGFTTAPGYGNNWNDILVYTQSVDNTVAHTVRLKLQYHYEVEPGYDFFLVDYDSANVWTNLSSNTGTNDDGSGTFPVPASFDQTWTYNVGDFSGTNGDEISMRLMVTSDGGWSDEDGLNPTTAGAAQVDNIEVFVDGGLVSSATFDGATGDADWQPLKAPFVGDFSKVFVQFSDIDPCRRNVTPQIGFIDDGSSPNNAPGQTTGGVISANWSYGITGGWVVNWDGGLTFGSDFALNDEMWSPEILWDDPSTTADDGLNGGAFIRFSEWVHLPRLNGMRWTWAVRSFPDDTGQWSGWQSRGFVYFGGVPTYSNQVIDVSDLMVQSPTKVQMRLATRDMAEIFGYPGGDSTPSPLYDNAGFAKYQAGGPAHTQRTLDVFQDSFPNSGSINPSNLAALSVRIDRSLDISTGINNIAGDSTTVTVVPVLPGTSIQGVPRMNWVLDANPLFDGVRVMPAGAVMAGSFVGRDGRSWNRWTGTVDGQQSTTATGVPIDDVFFFDLPDGPANPNAAFQTDEDPMFFPGDVIRYHIETTDTGGSTSTLPANIAGFFDGNGYSRTYTIRALPSLLDPDGDGLNIIQPDKLLINDFGRRGGENDYVSAFSQNGFVEGFDYDVYTAQAPSSSISDGIGSAGVHGANAQQLADYSVLMYVTGNLTNGLSDGVLAGDKGNDIEVLNQWHDLAGDRFAVYFGDNFSSRLNTISASGQIYLQIQLGVQINDADVRDEIDNQTAPRVVPTGALAGSFLQDFVAFGGCLGINTFDSIVPLAPAVASHEFLNPLGNSGSYSVAASVWNERTQNIGGTVYRRVDLTFPYGFVYVWDSNAKAPGGASARARLLQEILEAFGKTVNDGNATPAPTPGLRTALGENTPNPFNPATKIAFRIGEAGRYSLKIYDLQGRLVTTLINGDLEAGEQSVTWNGRDASERAVSSGVYLYELKGKSFHETRKMALVK